MSNIYGLCPDCGRALLQDYAAGGHRYLSCMGGHAWTQTRGELAPRIEHEYEPGPVQRVVAAAEHEPVIPEQPEAFRWVYGHGH